MMFSIGVAPRPPKSFGQVIAAHPLNLEQEQRGGALPILMLRD